MPDSDVIFGPRKGTDLALQPTPQDLSEFLDRTQKESVDETHVSDVMKFRRLLSKLETFESRGRPPADPGEVPSKLTLGTLQQTGFLNRQLLLAVSQYKYHAHALAALDFAGPAGFIESADEKRKKLKRTRISDVERLMRLDEMVAERRRMLDELGKRWSALTAELIGIARYVSGNLTRIEGHCARSIGALVEAGVRRQKELQLTEDIKTYFKNELKRATQVRKLTAADLEQVKAEAEGLTREFSEIVRDDLYCMTGVLEALLDHVKRAIGVIEPLLGEIGHAAVEGRQGHVVLFRRIEQALVLLIADYPRQLDPSLAPKARASSHAVVAKKRLEMIDHLLRIVRGERRKRTDRRAADDRRKGQDPSYTGPERRKSGDRRSGKGRRV